MKISVISKDVEVDQDTFQPLLTVVVKIETNVEALQDARTNFGESTLYADIGKAVSDAITAAG